MTVSKISATCWIVFVVMSVAFLPLGAGILGKMGEEFGIERLSAVVRRGSSLSAQDLMGDIFSSATEFCSEAGFNDDVTILVVKCDFDGSAAPSS